MTATQITASADGGGYLIQYSDTVLYAIWNDNNDSFWQKSTDAGVTWGAANGIFGLGGQVTFSHYYRKWHDPSAAAIVDFFAHVDAVDRGFRHRQLTLGSDTLGTSTEIANAGAAPFLTVNGSCVAESGRIWAAGGRSATVNVGTWWSEDEGASWTQFGATVAEIDGVEAAFDHAWMWPDFAASDPDDAMCIYHDDTAGELTVKRLDASAGTISETAPFATSVVFGGHTNISGALSPTTEHLRLAFANDASPTTIRTFDITGATVTEKTAVITATARVYNVSLSIIPDTDWTICFYGRDAGGASESAIEVYYKISTDGMATWGAEQLYGSRDSNVDGIHADPVPRNTTPMLAAIWRESVDTLYIETPLGLAADAVDQYRLMLSDGVDPDIPVLNITSQNIAPQGITLVRYERGRDAAMLGAPPRAGQGSVRLENTLLAYGLDEPTVGLAVRLNKKYGGIWNHLFQGNISEGPIHHFGHGDEGFRAIVDLIIHGSLTKLAGKMVSTGLLKGATTGECINAVLDAASFPSHLRVIADGVVVHPYFWVDYGDALAELVKLLNSEGITAELYEQGDGKVVFRDRNARYTDTRSTVVQSTITNTPSTLIMHQFQYTPGSRGDIFNFASHERFARTDDTAATIIWEDDPTNDGYILAPPGFVRNTLVIEVIADEPFFDAIVPVNGVDYVVGFGSATATLNRTSGQRLLITYTGGPAGATIGQLQLRATTTIAVGPFIEVSEVDADASIAAYGYRPWTGEMSKELDWADMRDNLDAIVSIKQEPRGKVRVEINAVYSDAANEAVAEREIGDLVRIQETALGFDGNCWIERIEHEVVAPAAEAEGPSVGFERHIFECSVVSVAVGSSGSGVSATNPYDAIDNGEYVLPTPLTEQGLMTRGMVAGVFFGTGP